MRAAMLPRSVRFPLLALLAMLLAWQAVHAHAPRASHEGGTRVLCNAHLPSVAMTEALAALAPEEFGALMRKAAQDDDCSSHCGLPGVALPRVLLPRFDAPAAMGRVPSPRAAVPRPPATGPPRPPANAPPSVSV